MGGQCQIVKRRPIVLAFSGGLDTQVALRWLQEYKESEVVAFVADLGQPDAAEAARIAESLGAEVHLVDCCDEFASDYVFVAGRANAVYAGQYLMGPSLGRPLIAARQVEVARAVGAWAVAHGATGKGNDQVRFELTYAALAPDLDVIAPWRIWPFNSRSDLLDFAVEHSLPAAAQRTHRPFSVDESVVHTSYEGESLEDPNAGPPEEMFRRTKDPELVGAGHEEVTIGFERGDPKSIDGVVLSPSQLIRRLDEIGARFGIGRLDLVEDRIFGLKTRNIYEAPAATILWHAHRAVESITIDGEVIQLREELVPKYARLVYRGLWHSPERRVLQAAVDESNRTVTGNARLRLTAGSVQVVGRTSPNSLYQKGLATFESSDGLPKDAGDGWLKIESLRFGSRT